MQEHDPARTLVFHPSTRSVVYFGEFRLDLADGALSRGGEEVRLPPRALVLLQYLVERAGRIVSKQALMEAAWKEAHVSETSLTEAVGLIRQALHDDPQQPRFIQTVHRRGYRFIAPISTDAPSPLPQAQPSREAIPAPVAQAAPSPAQTETVAASRAARRRSRVVIVALAATALAATAAAVWLATRPAQLPQVVRVNVALPADQAPAPNLTAHPAITISPDGERVVYVAGEGSAAKLYLRYMDRFEATPLAGTEGAHGPFFSPDGDWVGFFAHGKLMRIRVRGGDASPRVICATPTGVGGAWLSHDEIVFTPDWTGPLMRVPAAGGEPTVAAAPRIGRSYRWPSRLDDSTVIATRWQSSADDAAVVAISLPSGNEQVIAQPATFGRPVAGGFVVFLRNGDVHGVRLDPTSHRPVADPIRVLPSVLTGMTGAAQFTVSESGSLLYIPDVPERSHRVLERVDLHGRSSRLPTPPRAFRNYAVCDGRLAATIYERGQTSLWTGYVDREAFTRITNQGSAFEPTWTPDCRTVAFAWNRSGVTNMYTVQVDSGEAPRLLFESPRAQLPGSWSPDGRWLAYIEDSSETDGDIWVWDRETGQKRPALSTSGLELLPRLSPDGKHVAYETNVSGDFEVEVAAIASGARVQVSSGGGAWPAWSADGRQLSFLHDETIMRVDIQETRGRLIPGNPVPIFSNPGIVLFHSAGDQFVWLRRTAETTPLTRMNLILNWRSELETEIR